MLVLNVMMNNLREFLCKNPAKITWEQKYDILYEIAASVHEIHKKNYVHRDLHSGNILIQKNLALFISDLGFCGPVSKSLNDVYGVLPFIAPEVLNKQPYTKEADIYSLAIIMWEIAAEEVPYYNKKYDYELVYKILGGMRPPLDFEIPQEYMNLMMQCWDAIPENRPDIMTFWKTIREMRIKLVEAKDDGISKEKFLNISLRSPENSYKSKNYSPSRFTSKLQHTSSNIVPKNVSIG